MATWLRQSTAVEVPVGPFVDNADGNTVEGSLTITQPDVRLKKNGGAWAQKSAAQTLSHEEAGWYEVSLSTTDTDTLGILVVAVHETGALPVWREFMVMPAVVYDALIAGSGDGIRADVRAWLGTAAATPTVAGVPEVDLTHIAGSAVSPTTAQLGVNVIQAAGTVWGSGAITANAIAAAAATKIRGGTTGTANSNGGTTSFVCTTLTQSDFDYWKDALVVFTSGTLAGVARRVTRFQPFADRVYFWPPTPVAVSAHTFELIPAPPSSRQLSVETVEYFQIPGSISAEMPYSPVWVRGRLYVGMYVPSTFNARVMRFNNPTVDLSDFDSVDLPDDGVHEGGYRLAYSPLTDLIYVKPQTTGSNRNIVTSIDPDTLEQNDVIDDSTSVIQDNVHSGGICVIDDHLYVLTSGGASSTSQILKYQLSDYAKVDSVDLTACPRGRWLDFDGEHLFAAGDKPLSASSWVAKILPSDLSFTAQELGENQGSAGQFAFANGYVWIPIGSGTAAGDVVRVSRRDITSLTTFPTGLGLVSNVALNAVVNALGSLWLIGAGAAFARLDPDSLEIDYHEGPTQGGIATLLTTNGNFLFLGSDDVNDDVHMSRMVVSPAPGYNFTTSIPDAVWNAPRANHVIPGSFGQATQFIFTGAVASATASTIVLGAAAFGDEASEVDDYYNGMVVAVVAGTGKGQKRLIDDYTGSTGTLSTDADWDTTPDNTSKIVIFGV